MKRPKHERSSRTDAPTAACCGLMPNDGLGAISIYEVFLLDGALLGQFFLLSCSVRIAVFLLFSGVFGQTNNTGDVFFMKEGEG